MTEYSVLLVMFLFVTLAVWGLVHFLALYGDRLINFVSVEYP